MAKSDKSGRKKFFGPLLFALAATTTVATGDAISRTVDRGQEEEKIRKAKVVFGPAEKTNSKTKNSGSIRNLVSFPRSGSLNEFWVSSEYGVRWKKFCCDTN